MNSPSPSLSTSSPLLLILFMVICIFPGLAHKNCRNWTSSSPHWWKRSCEATARDHRSGFRPSALQSRGKVDAKFSCVSIDPAVL
ncbi:hypothetical protein OH76DRAFT_1009132 [Lentinus brumalis]|uniref:Secreted protein n=1 Tax=Lentinus brumalis TaxID=2498619 RepID=A0A371CY93_9APHY|nr:hypothetical protein OH76DRAFT_1009132 [Polyporus brumalis]